MYMNVAKRKREGERRRGQRLGGDSSRGGRITYQNHHS